MELKNRMIAKGSNFGWLITDVYKVTPGRYAGIDSVEPGHANANANANSGGLTLRTLVLGGGQW